MNESERARDFGIEQSYEGPGGSLVRAPPETIRRLLRLLDGPVPGGDVVPATALAACYLPSWLRDRPAWGIALQLYELRSQRNWGIGDLVDLAVICRIAGEAGADFVGLNPLHALFLAAPERCSPFSPSSRRFLNPLYIAVDRVDGFRPAIVPEGSLATLRAADLVDYRTVAEIKLYALRLIWKERRSGLRPMIAAALEAEPQLAGHALFEALSLHLGSGSGGWRDWPVQFHDRNGVAAAAFAEEHPDDIAFHAWLQLLARRQLAEAAEAARAAGMRIGLYLDFAVGEAPDGSASWSEPELLVSGISIGAPPDMFTATGQNWGVAPLAPRQLAADGCAPYRSLMGAAMRNAGALRVDHAMSLQQLFWIPDGTPASDGAYVRYPMREMIAALAALSHENRVMLIGEDLGHVPPGFRDKMAAARILSCRILYFEAEEGAFRPAADWPELALACVSTHDLPTLKGWWSGADVELRLEHGLIEARDAAAQRQVRAKERSALISLLFREGLLETEVVPEEPDPRLGAAIHRFLARTPCVLAAFRLADAVGEAHPTNLPGTSDSWPNWRRKLGVPIEELHRCDGFLALADAMNQERPH